tara:strand:- start:3693 stop:4112 length:420 start_codon:yes stop_codon:yes gene_type:complete
MSYVIAAIAITGQVVSTFATVEAGKARQEALERRAEEEKFAAQQDELKRQEELNAIQAANIVALSNAGIKAEGTPPSIALETSKVIGESTGVNIANLSNRLRGLEMEGKQARSSANLQAASLLLKDARGIGEDINLLIG